ncbi:GTP cyclohydrolase FolE2 [Halalkalibacterium halodurans]|uniref:GTP cyclohydrolase FolE2 n=1 Tax=Halalkalibacterium halodurans TaxID=86665 RepID=UPI002E2251ED|nr:GTP cyclohydrolase FolE2 [Halalkalibacterium halodurans]MED4125618.1 GTP cyclohydrolase FolE2 [Halalkalibacterium halodurans]
MKTKQWPSKTERHKRFGSVPPVAGKKPIHKEEMADLQNMPNDFLFALDSVGIHNVKHPCIIQSNLKSYEQTTVGTFSLTTSLEQMSKGINMSRLTELLQEYHQTGFILSLKNMQAFTKDLAERMEQSSAHVHVTFPWFFERESPSLNKIGLAHAEARLNVHFDETLGFTHEVGLTAAVTTLCPCSKEISEYSAHNQRGYVTIKATFYEPTEGSDDWKVTLLEAAESNASSILYPVLKRPDEKAVTEKAYENPRFVEDMVRLTAADLYENETIKAFTVECRNEESIHQHDAIATLSYSKK